MTKYLDYRLALITTLLISTTISLAVAYAPVRLLEFFSPFLGVITALLLIYLVYRYTASIIIVLLTLLPFYPLTVMGIETVFGLSGTSVLLLRSIRDVIVISIFIVVLAKSHVGALRPNRVDLLIWVLMGLNLIYVLMPGAEIQVKLMSLRENYFYFIFYFLGRYSWFSFTRLTKLGRNIIFVAVLICVFALVQAYVLGPAFLAKFRSINVLFVSSRSFWGVQRAVGTFAHAIELGGYLLIVVALNLWGLQQGRRKLLLWGTMILFLVTIAATFTRSVWIGAIVLFAVILRSPRYRKLLLSLTVVLVLVIPFTPVGAYVKASLAGQEGSANYHQRVLFDSIEYLLNHPLGSGLGSVGVAGVRSGGEALFFEGFYFNLAGEIGWIGAGLYLLIVVMTFVTLIRIEHSTSDIQTAQLSRAMQGAFAGIAVTGFFLPLMASREIAFTLWFLLGSTMSLYRYQSRNPSFPTKSDQSVSPPYSAQ